MASMGDVFIEWCESYFVETQNCNVEEKFINSDGKEVTTTIVEEIKGTLNEYIPRYLMQKNYSDRAGKFSKTSANFKKSLQQYCKMKGYIFNPKDKCGSDGMIKRPIVDEKGKRQIVEHFFIQTNNQITKESIIEEKPINEPDILF